MSTPNPLGAWGKPLVVREQTEEEKQREIDLAAQRKRDEEALAINQAAQTLANKIEKAISSRDGGQSSNYVGDEQYEVKGSYSTTVILLAFTKWKDNYSTTQITNLNIHMLGPSAKYTGGRNGRKQANFIRYISETQQKYRFNIHINAS